MRLLSLFAGLCLVAFAMASCGQERDQVTQEDFLLDSISLTEDMGVPASEADQVARETNRYIADIGGGGAYRELLVGLGAQPSARSIAATSGFLVMRGAVRLGEEAIDSVATLRSGWIERFGCETTVSSSAGSASRWQLMAQLDSTALANLMDFYTETTLAVINQTGTVPEFDRERLVSAGRAFHARLPASERDRFVRFLDARSPSTDEECWFQSRLWEMLPDLSEANGRIILWQIATNEF